MLEFMFLNIWHFLGCFLILLILSNVVVVTISEVSKIIQSFSTKEKHYYYISERNVDEEFLNELKNRR
jgi:hypothetical protein